MLLLLLASGELAAEQVALVARALAALTAAPAAIRVERVEVQLRRAPTSGYAVAVSYTNLRTADRRARTVTV